MAINKDKNVMIQVTFLKEDAKNLEALKNAFNKNGVKVSKSDILTKAFREYLKMIIAMGAIQQKKTKVEEPQKEKKDA